MVRLTDISNIPFIGRFIAHIRVPLYRNGYALILTSISTSALGVLYWILAARTYTTETVGLNAAAIAAMTFVSGVAQFNLMSALVRFVPTAGRSTRRLVLVTYLVSTLVTGIVSLCFVVGLSAFGQQSPTLDFLAANPAIMTLFVLATAAWCIFTLQDSVMTGLGQAIWVPIENTAFALLKLGLLLGLAQVLPQYGIFVSWTIAFMVCVPPINFLIFRYLIPKRMQTKGSDVAPPSVGQIVQYVAGDYLGSLFWIACTDLQPVLVVQVAGASANAYFYLAWSIVYSIYNVGSGMGLSLVVEASREPAKLGLYSYRAFRQVARLVVPLVLVLMLGAPYILEIFGSSYAAEGAPLLRLLALSAIPNMVVALYLSVARVQRRVRAIVSILASACLGVLSLGYILLQIYGIIGIGWAWVIVQTAIATILLLTQFVPLWMRALSQVEHRERPVDSSNVFSQTRRVLRAWQRAIVLWVYDVSTRLGWLPFLKQRRLMMKNERQLTEALPILSSVLPLIPAQESLPMPTTWSAHEALHTVNDLTVITIGPAQHSPKRGHSPIAVLKLPQSEQAMQSLHHQLNTLKVLQSDPRLDDWTGLLPRQWAEGTIEGQAFVVEELIGGVDARSLRDDRANWVQMQLTAARAIGVLHRRTAVCVRVDESLRAKWIDERLLKVRGVTAMLPNAADYERAIERMARELHSVLAERTVSISWIHGDFAPDNLLVTPDGKELMGIIDWELAEANELPLLDLMQLFLGARTLEQGQEIGAVVCALLHPIEGTGRGDWQPHERELLDLAQGSLRGEAVELRTLLLLCWLRHVAANLSKSAGYASHWVWIRQNVESVLHLFLN